MDRLEILDITLTPELAHHFLLADAINRVIHPQTVLKYAGAIERGEWVRNGECLLFTADGILVDGQHRCCAVIATGQAVETSIIVGVDADHFDKINLGLMRHAGNTMQILHMPYPHEVGAAAKLLWQFGRGLLDQRGITARPSQTQLRDLLARHPSLPDSVRPASPIFHLFARSQAVFIHYLLSRVDPDAATAFCTHLGSGLGLDTDGVTQPIYVVREMFVRNKGADKPFSAAERTYLCMVAWNDWRRGRRKSRYPLGSWDHQTWPVLR